MKRAGEIDAPLTAIMTDFLPHAYWLHQAIDRYIVHTDAAAQYLQRHGVGMDRIDCCGIPVHPAFTRNGQQEHNRHASPPIVLIMGGKSGLGPIKDMVTAIDRLPQPCQLVVLAGNNRSLLRWCQRRMSQMHHRLTACGLITNVDYWMHRSAVLVTKPGGMTTAEALVSQLPMVLVNPIPGQESNNAQVLLQSEAAVLAMSPEQVAARVSLLLTSAPARHHMQDSAARLAKPSAAADIVASLQSMVS